MKEIRIKGLADRYKCYLDDNNDLEIYNEKGCKLGSKFPYNSEQTAYCLYCEDGIRRSFYTLRLLYAYTNDLSVLDIPKGCIYREKYGLSFYNGRKIIKRPLKEIEIGENTNCYIEQLDKHWEMIKNAIKSKDITEISKTLMAHKDEVMRRVRCSTGCAKEVLEDCFYDSVDYYLRRIVDPKYKMFISLPQDALTSFSIKRYKTYYKKKTIKYTEWK